MIPLDAIVIDITARSIARAHVRASTTQELSLRWAVGSDVPVAVDESTFSKIDLADAGQPASNDPDRLLRDLALVEVGVADNLLGSALGSTAGQMALQLGEPTLREVCGRFLDDRARSCKPRSLRSYEQSVRLILGPALGDLPLGEITRSHVLDLHERARDNNGPAASNRAIKVARMIWHWAVDEGLVGDRRCPFKRIRPWATPKRRNPILPEQAARVWRICEAALAWPTKEDPCTPVHAAYFITLLLVGLRMREGTHLRRDEYRRDRGELVITHHKTDGTVGEKVLTLSAAAVGHMNRLEDEFRWHPVLFFPSNRSATGWIENPWPAWQNVLAAAAVQGVTLHDLRRGFATAALNAGIELRVVQEQLGHASIRTTATYAIPGPALKRLASDAVAAAYLSAAAAPLRGRGGDRG